jgi:hypothetical protein
VACDATNDCETSSSSWVNLSSLGESSAERLSEVVLSSEFDEMSSIINLSSENLVSSSMRISSSSRFVAVSSVMSSFNEVWDGGSYNNIRADDIDKWGLVGEDKGAFMFPWTDVMEGGNSQVLDQTGNPIGLCPFDDKPCEENWDISGVFVEVDWTVSHLSSELKVTDFVPSSKESWGWATAGWWFIYSYDKDFRGETPFEKAKPIGLTENSWFSMSISYPKGEILTIELKGEDIDEDDPNQSPPRFSYEGKGRFYSIGFPVRAIKRAGWSVPSTYDPEKVTAVGLLRMEAGLSEGAQFPSVAKEKNRFEFSCIGFGRSNGDNACWGL